MKKVIVSLLFAFLLFFGAQSIVEEVDQIIVHINNAQSVVNARGVQSMNQLTKAEAGAAVVAKQDFNLQCRLKRPLLSLHKRL